MKTSVNRSEFEFLKIMFGDLHAQKLRIPPHFRKHILKDLSDKATLEGPSGDCRSVKVEICGREIYLSESWPQFIRENSLGNNEFLVFKYKEKMHFKVQIFNSDRCERMKSSIKQQESVSCNKKRKRIEPRKTPVSKPHKDSSGEYVAHSGSIKLPLPKVQNGIDARNIANRTTWNLPILEQNARKKANRTTWNLPIDVPRDKPLTQEEKRAWNEAKSFTSSNPWGLYWISGKFRIMRFRLPFSKAYLPQTITVMSLRTPDGRTWQVTYLPERSFLSKGWPQFSCDNDIREGTLCAFELVGEKEFLVHIFRSK